MSNPEEFRHSVLDDTAEAISLAIQVCRQADSLSTEQFRSLFGYLGSHKRSHKPIREIVSRLRIVPGISNRQLQLVTEQLESKRIHGWFDGFARILGRMDPDVFAKVITAASTTDPDDALNRLVSEFDGKIPGMGLASFSGTCSLIRPDLYPVTNDRAWRDSWYEIFKDSDYRRYVEFAQHCRTFCDQRGWPPANRFRYFDEYIQRNIKAETQDLLKCIPVAANRSTGPGRSSDAARNAIIEKYACRKAIEHFTGLGYKIRLRGKPYDLECIRGQERLEVEVKGTSMAPSEDGLVTVSLTKNEYDRALDRTTGALCIVHSIVIQESKDGLAAGGGILKIFHPWIFDQGAAEAVQFNYQIACVSADAS